MDEKEASLVEAKTMSAPGNTASEEKKVNLSQIQAQNSNAGPAEVKVAEEKKAEVKIEQEAKHAQEQKHLPYPLLTR